MYMTRTDTELHDNDMNYLLSVPIDEDNMTNVFKTTAWSINVPYMKQIQHYIDNNTQDKTIDGISKILATSRKLPIVHTTWFQF
jgi:hypothetical protein